jgi:hypothetical protein
VKERLPKYKTFGGKRYERVGSAPTKSKSVADKWAKFQRDVNNLNARVVKAPAGGYEIYIRRK